MVETKQETCVKCGKPKEQGDECPHCGVYYAKAENAIGKNTGKEKQAPLEKKENPYTKKIEGRERVWLLAGCAIMFIGFIWYQITSPPSLDSTKRQSRVAAVTGDDCYTKGGYIYAINKEYFSKAMDMQMNKDTLALAKLSQTGAIGISRPGVKVFRENISVWQDAVIVRPEGATASVWVSINAIKCK